MTKTTSTTNRLSMPRISSILLLGNLLLEGFSLIAFMRGVYGTFDAATLTMRTLYNVAVLWLIFQNYRVFSSFARGYYYVVTCIYISRSCSVIMGWVRMGNAYFTQNNMLLPYCITLLYTVVYCYTTWQLLYNGEIAFARKKPGEHAAPPADQPIRVQGKKKRKK